MTHAPHLYPPTRHAHHAHALEQELAWLQHWISQALDSYFQNQPFTPPPAPAPVKDAAYTQAVTAWGLSEAERLVLILALAPHVRPSALDLLLLTNSTLGQPFTEFAGCPSPQHRGFWPSAETAAFLLAGHDMARRLPVYPLFAADAPLRRAGVLSWGLPASDAPALSALLGQPLQLSPESLSLLTSGQPYQPNYGKDFPAQRITTPLDWDDLVLPGGLRQEVNEIIAWIDHRHTLMNDWQLNRHLKPGFRALFYGPPGTGKTLTATLLGKATGMPVYRVDLSLVVSKYIGETEKNLSRVFDQAERQHWILFFDEADALFGKRSQTNSSNDRYANQEVAYLLQRVEDFPGVTLLASNLKSNIDEAFARRFQSMLYFPLPAAPERLQLWRNAFTLPCPLAADCDLTTLAEQVELSGGAISNVLRYAALQAVQRDPAQIIQADLLQGVAREQRKDGRI